MGFPFLYFSDLSFPGEEVPSMLETLAAGNNKKELSANRALWYKVGKHTSK